MQARARQTDPRTDIYSFGCILYELATGVVPFSAQSPISTLCRHITDTPARLEYFETGKPVPPEFQNLVTRCIEKDPADRYQTAWSLLKELEEIIEKLARETEWQGLLPVIEF